MRSLGGRTVHGPSTGYVPRPRRATAELRELGLAPVANAKRHPALSVLGGDAEPSGVLRLQRLVGNRAVSSLIEARSAGDGREPRRMPSFASDALGILADAEAGHRIATPAKAPAKAPATTPVGASEVPAVAALHAPERERAADSMAAQVASASTASTTVAVSRPSPRARASLDRTDAGRPLPLPLRGRLESGYGADLSAIRLHDGPRSHLLNESISARAFTHGSDIHFSRGELDTTSRRGVELVAHEVAHAVNDSGPTTSSAVPIPVQAKLRGTASAVVAKGGEPGPGGGLKGLRKRVFGSNWQDLVSQLRKYEALEASHDRSVTADAPGAHKVAATQRTAMVALLAKIEATALKWQRANRGAENRQLVEQMHERQKAKDTVELERDERFKPERTQAVAMLLPRVRMELTDLRSGRYGATIGLDDTKLAWSHDDAVGGGINRLDQTVYNLPGGAQLEGFFKAEKGADQHMAGRDVRAGITSHDPNWGARSVAMYRLDQLLQGGVIARSEFAVHTSWTRKEHHSTEHSPATTKMGVFTEKAKGEEMGKLTEKDRVALTGRQRQRADDPSSMIDLEDPTLQRCLNKLQIIDAIAGQLDRHAKNYFVQRDSTGKVLGVTGIDNDMAFGSLMTDPKAEAQNYLGVPELVDAEFGQRLLQITPAQIRATLNGLLSAAEIDATIQRFSTIQDMVQKLQTSGQLTKEWNAETSRRQLTKGGGGAHADPNERGSQVGREGGGVVNATYYAIKNAVKPLDAPEEHAIITLASDAVAQTHLAPDVAVETAVAVARILTEHRRELENWKQQYTERDYQQERDKWISNLLHEYGDRFARERDTRARARAR